MLSTALCQYGIGRALTDDAYLFSHEDGNALYAGLKKYFEFYNHVRLHQSLNYETPVSWYFQQAA
jgi:putative transposase